jgi:hypothetical protein
MVGIGFPVRWCELMKFVTIVSFSVRMNGAFSPSFTPTRSIRQGDSITPFLFLLCAERLTSMRNNCGPQYIAKGIQVEIHAPWISHLFFVDDSLIFMQAYRMIADRLVGILDTYHRGSC